VIDIYNELRYFDPDVCVYDPWAEAAEVRHKYFIEINNGETKPVFEDYAAIILEVSHKKFNFWSIQKSANQVVFDVKSVLTKEKVNARLEARSEKQEKRP